MLEPKYVEHLCATHSITVMDNDANSGKRFTTYSYIIPESSPCSYSLICHYASDTIPAIEPTPEEEV